MSDTLTTLREKVAQAIDAIEELDGPMPYEARLIALLDPAESLRAAVRATKSEAKRAVLALLSSLPPSPEPGTWQPIETAPKDRLFIGGFIDDYGELRHVQLCSGDWSSRLTHWADVEIPQGTRFSDASTGDPR